MLQLKTNKTPEKLERSIRLRRLRQRRYRARASAGVKFIGHYFDMQLLRFILVEQLEWLPPGDYSDEELEIAYIAFIEDWQNGWCPA
jgi:hypothetical protein